MSHFRTISNKKIIPFIVCNEYSEHIVLKLYEISQKDYTYKTRNVRKLNSNAIKYGMVTLGHELGFRVYANGLTNEQKQEQFDKHKFLNKEFLYDIHWYKDKADEHYMPETVSLVAESELGDRRKGDKSMSKNPAIKFDFQKLLIANAKLRLLIFKVKNQRELDELDAYFEKSIATYELLNKGSMFLFICFLHDTKEFLFCEKSKY